MTFSERKLKLLSLILKIEDENLLIEIEKLIDKGLEEENKQLLD